MRRWRLIAQIGFVAVLATLAFPGEGSALSAVTITLTASGPSPADLTISAGMYPFWANSDTTTHSVEFANGLCSLQLAPNTSAQCPTAFAAGRYPYTVDGTTQASLVVTAVAPDTVTLTARGHALRRGAALRLHGILAAYECCLPPPTRAGLRVTVLARNDRHHAFRRLAQGVSGTQNAAGYHYPWSLRVRPRTTTIYIARVRYVRGGVPGLQAAWSRPFKVRVSPPRR